MSEVAHIRGTTWHGRKGDLENSFRYTVDYLMIDLDPNAKSPDAVWPQSRVAF